MPKSFKYSREFLRALARQVRKRLPRIKRVEKVSTKTTSLYDSLVESTKRGRHE